MKEAFYKALSGFKRPVFVREGKTFEVDFYAIWGAVFVTVPPDMTRRAAIEKAFALVELVPPVVLTDKPP